MSDEEAAAGGGDGGDGETGLAAAPSIIAPAAAASVGESTEEEEELRERDRAIIECSAHRKASPSGRDDVRATISSEEPHLVVSTFFAAAGSADSPRFIPFPLQRKFRDAAGLPG